MCAAHPANLLLLHSVNYPNLEGFRDATKNESCAFYPSTGLGRTRDCCRCPMLSANVLSRSCAECGATNGKPHSSSGINFPLNVAVFLRRGVKWARTLTEFNNGHCIVELELRCIRDEVKKIYSDCDEECSMNETERKFKSRMTSSTSNLKSFD